MNYLILLVALSDKINFFLLQYKKGYGFRSLFYIQVFKGKIVIRINLILYYFFFSE